VKSGKPPTNRGKEMKIDEQLERDQKLDQVFAQMYWIEKQARKTKKGLEKIAKYLTPAERDEIVEGCEGLITLLQEPIREVQSITPNPDAPPYQRKTKKAYLKIYRDTMMAERAQRFVISTLPQNGSSARSTRANARCRVATSSQAGVEKTDGVCQATHGVGD
jgi:hypothetical protein